MKHIHFLLLTLLTTFSCMAQQTNVFAKDHTEPVLTMKCIFMLGGICVLIAGAAYYAGSNKRGRMQNNSNTSGNTPS